MNLSQKRILLFGVALACLCSLQLVAQDLASIGKENPFSVSGGISANQIFYKASGIDSRRDPYSYYVSGNVNFGLYGWSVPLSFSYSNQNFSYQQPFNQYSLHPTYKWITGHVGYTSMTFSPYTLSGHVFLGVGIDATPTGKLKISAMYGRLRRAVELDTLTERNEPSYERRGYGFKVNYGDGRRFIELTTFRAKDDSTSIGFIPDDYGVKPQENLVFSLGGGMTFFEKLMVKAEWANSAITRDQRVAENGGRGIFGSMGGIFTPRISTAYYNAIKSSLSYQGNGYAVGLGYERIDPEYTTLGAYYFNNDLENITVNGATALAGGKVNLSASVGTQRDNLNGDKITTMRRVVSALNVGFVPNEKLNLSTSYSNFQTYTNVRSQFVTINQVTPYDNLDTLNFTQITQNLTLTGNYLLPSTEQKKRSISANLSIMKAADKQVQVEQNSGSTFYNINTAYSLSIVPSNLTLSASFNYSLNEAAGMKSSTMGPSLTASKALFDKKMRVTGSCSANNTYVDGTTTSRVMTIRANTGYTIKQKHSLSLNLVALTRTQKSEAGSKGFKEFTGTLGYNYSFGN
ncbi:porin family protein [Pseudochryseolinea flava]|uniref:Outer membrane protein beta-barrel domain-containing protein n=1 Tax=Pseudochryseolinea flava TaxID=2059302 RepID=A0A364XTX8_9BACT|nr:hypothetical protein [Pseudochryseolinea flava]RAV97628.1 hypothetical protein DQQ10_27485 [Pseudochryseolinea flava]